MAGPGAETLLAGLTAAQRTAVTSDAGVLGIVAGAGSGKTTVLTRRIAWRVAAGTATSRHVLVVTFTRKAAGELRDRLARLDAGEVWAGTFHAAAFSQLRRHWADTGRPPPTIVSDSRGIVRDLLTEETGLDERVVRIVTGELAWSHARMLGPGDYPAAAGAEGRHPGLALEQVASLLERYEVEARRRGVIDLDQLPVACARLLEDGGAAADALRWRFRHLFVDEFQDVNPAQWRLLSAWHHDRDDLCVVGDPRQAVYAWNGSDPSLLGRLPALLPGAVVVRLDENHRSSPQIVAAAAAVLEAAPPGEADTYPAGEAPLSAGLADGPPPTVRGFVHEEAEAAEVARWLRRARRPGHPWHHQAVLARTNARLVPIADALRRAGIPCHHAGRREDASGQASGVVRALRAADRRAPLRAVLVEALADTADTASAGMTWPTGGSEVAELFGCLADEYAAEEPSPSVGGFLAWLAANPGAVELPGARRDGVVLATFHRAKGLEWAAVAVVGLEEGTVPIAYATDRAARAEERRLFYVAVSRARRDLWCSWAARPSPGHEGHERRPSSFLDAVRTAAAVEPSEPAVVLGRIAELRSRLPKSLSADVDQDRRVVGGLVTFAGVAIDQRVPALGSQGRAEQEQIDAHA